MILTIVGFETQRSDQVDYQIYDVRVLLLSINWW